ncbi:MAG: nucleotidyl transferase AbiEii/AbiGii toxin family protein [Candidatus Diapherotrites archaeon]
MIPGDFIQKITNTMNITNTQMVEKDLYLQGLLLELEKSTYFTNHFTFKGGTCLTKVYYGYYRFSEDLDFTWIDPQKLESNSANETRRKISHEIAQLMTLFEKAGEKTGLDFKAQKSNKHYIQLGGSNRFVTFKFWYQSAISRIETFIKIQFNFTEKLFHSSVLRTINPIANNFSSHQKAELEKEYPVYGAWAIQPARLHTYNIKEIAAEKIRAILTRRGIKARDYVDLYILNQKKIKVKEVETLAIQKTVFMLNYEKYDQNLSTKTFNEKIDLGKEEALMIQPIGKDFQSFIEKKQKELLKIAQTVKREYAKTK